MSSEAHRRGFLCPRCRQRFPYRRQSTGAWYTCVCGEKFVIPARPAPEPRLSGKERGVQTLVYGLGGAILLSFPVAIFGARLIGAGLYTGVLGITALIGFLIGGILGERAINTIGQGLRSTFERRF